MINAADYGIPQIRERVFIIGVRSDISVDWSFPDPTHSHEALIYEKYVSGLYWNRHNITDKKIINYKR
ncbi:MAG: DNA cytosine methyltransferase, partial [Sulfurimonas sp.]